MGEIIKLKELVDMIQDEIKKEVENIEKKYNKKINIVCLSVGKNPDSESYIAGIKKVSEKVGINSHIIYYEPTISEEEFCNEIEKFNNDIDIEGLIIQNPLPKSWNLEHIYNKISFRKDIDCATTFNLGLLFKEPILLPATSWACDITLVYLAKKYGFQLSGKTVAIIGRSNTVGKPFIHLALKRNMTPTVIHTKTIDKEKISSSCDIVVASCGVAELIDESWIKEDSIVLDVGINVKMVDGNTKLCGDVNSQSASKKAKVVTAVPGGIGSVTTSLLFANSIKSYYMLKESHHHKFSFESL